MKKIILIMTMIAALFSASAADSVRTIAAPDTPERFKDVSIDTAVKAPGYETSLLWDFGKCKVLEIEPFPEDFIRFQGVNNALEIYLYEEKPQNAEILLRVKSENPAVEGVDCYFRRIPLNFEGWKRVEIPFTEMSALR